MYGILAATILASGMAFLAGTTVSVALPTIQSFFDVPLSHIQWVVNAYVLALAALLLLSGSLGDHIGRKKVFLAGIGIFTLGSALSGFAASAGQLIGFQALQGVGAAMMIPGSLAIINICISGAKRGRAIGLWAGLSGGLAALGPFVGGWLVENLGWPSIFFLNIPIGVIAFIVALAAVPESRDAEAGPIDWRGAALITLGLFGISFGLIQGPVMGWGHALVLAGLIGGVMLLALFVAVERWIARPVVPLRIFKNPLVAGANVATFLLYFALNGLIFFLVLNLQQVQGYTPTEAGLALLPPIVLITFLAGVGGTLADRFGPRAPMIAGPLVVAAGMALLILPGTETSYVRDFLPGLVLFGLGMASVIASITKSALAVEPRFSGAASGVNNAAARVAALMAIAVLGAVLVSLFSARLPGALDRASLPLPAQQEILAQADKVGGIEIPEAFSGEARIKTREAVSASFVWGFRWVMGVNALLALASAVVAVFTIRNKDALGIA